MGSKFMQKSPEPKENAWKVHWTAQMMSLSPRETATSHERKCL